MQHRESLDPTTQRAVPLAQGFFDDIFLMFVIGFVTPVLIYLIWGLVDVASIPTAPYLR